jgi:CRISP-associated protein Cas1
MVGGNSRYSARPELVEAQRSAQAGKLQVKIARWLIEAKLRASMATLSDAVPKSQNREIAISRVRKWISEIRNPRKLLSLPRIRGIEGDAASAYFSGWHGLPLKWSGLSRRPIPPSWHEIGPRKMGWLKRGTNARHPINAMLNYGYGILISQVRKQAVAAGLDPSIGVTHGNDKNQIPLVYDLMEPLRPVVDRKILEFALSHTFTSADFTINRHGGCRLNPQMVGPVVRAVDIQADTVVADFRRLLKPSLKVTAPGCLTMKPSVRSSAG